MNIPILSVINHLECPNRSTLVENKKLFDTRESIISYIVSKLFVYVLERTSKSKFPTVDELDKQLNLIWSKIRSKINFNVSTNDFIIIKSICSRVYTHLSSFQKIEVIVLDAPFFYSVGEDNIEIPISMIRSSNHLYLYYVDGNTYYDDIPSSYPIVGALLENVGEAITKGFKYSIHSNIYKCQSLRLYKTSKNKHVDIALESLIKGIKEVSYPRVSLGNCKVCKFKESCKWYDK